MLTASRYPRLLRRSLINARHSASISCPSVWQRHTCLCHMTRQRKADRRVSWCQSVRSEQVLEQASSILLQGPSVRCQDCQPDHVSLISTSTQTPRRSADCFRLRRFFWYRTFTYVLYWTTEECLPDKVISSAMRYTYVHVHIHRAYYRGL